MFKFWKYVSCAYWSSLLSWVSNCSLVMSLVPVSTITLSVLAVTVCPSGQGPGGLCSQPEAGPAGGWAAGPQLPRIQGWSIADEGLLSLFSIIPLLCYCIYCCVCASKLFVLSLLQQFLIEFKDKMCPIFWLVLSFFILFPLYCIILFRWESNFGTLRPSWRTRRRNWTSRPVPSRCWSRYRQSAGKGSAWIAKKKPDETSGRLTSNIHKHSNVVMLVSIRWMSFSPHWFSTSPWGKCLSP